MESGGRGGAADRPQTTQGRARPQAGASRFSQLGDRCAEPRYAIVAAAAAIAIAARGPRAGAVGCFARAGSRRLASGYPPAPPPSTPLDSVANPPPPALG